MSPATMPAGAENGGGPDLLIAQITDSHLKASGVRLFGAVDTYGALERAVAFLNAFEPRPDVVIHTGDLVNGGDEEDYEALAELLGRLAMPVLAVPGNHDRRDMLRKALAFTGAVPAEGPLCLAANVGPVRLVGLDSLVEGETGGRLGAEQLSWLDATLAATPDRPTIVFLHHPPFATGIEYMDGIMLADHVALADVIGGHRQVGLVACGHVHRTVVTRFAGTVAMIGPGVAHHMMLDMTDGAPLRWIPEPPAVAMHRFTPDWGFVSHVALVERHGADAPFSSHHTRVPR